MANDHASRSAAAMSIDVEDWFQVENLRRAVPRDSWKRRRLRVEAAMDRMLEHMARREVTATCFVLGWIAERLPHLVRRIADAGHEVACHGYGHQLLTELRPGEFRADVERSKGVLEEITGRPVRGYRAPSFSLTDWAIPLLQDAGFDYDSSFCPTSLTRTRYGAPASLRGNGSTLIAYDGFTEVALPCLTIAGQAVPWAGGGWFRLLPYPLFAHGVRRILDADGPYTFYIHPWELDAGQPRVTGLGHSERLRHYLNLARTEDRWSRLLRDFRWNTIAAVVDAVAPEPRGARHVMA